MRGSNTRLTNLNAWQFRIVIIGWITYAFFYLGRVNLSIAMPELRVSLNLSSQQVGLLGTGFFLSYALGQLISGHLGDRISPRILVFTGMLLSTLMNLIFASATIFGLLLVIWTANGFFQSTGWAPILKVLANWHTSESRRKVAGIYATSFVAGNAISWFLAGKLIANLGWRSAFWIPGTIMGIVALAWYLLIRDTPRDAGFTHLRAFTDQTPVASIQTELRPNMFHVFKSFWPLVLAAVTGGMLLFALIIWAPTYFVDIHALEIGAAANISILFPIAGTLGTLAVGWLLAGPLCCREIIFGALVFIVVAGLLFLFPLVSHSLLTSAVLLVLVGSILYGVNSIITTILPMILSDQHEVSTVAGLIDFAFNVGASLAGVGIGTIVDKFSWSGAFNVLGASAILTSCFLILFAYWTNKLRGVGFLKLDQSLR